jgi:hypothetical protein
MKTLTNLFTSNPSYMKWGNERIAKRTGLKPKTVEKFKKNPLYKIMKTQYLNEIN